MIIINESPRDTKQEMKRDCETCTSNHIIYVHFYELIHRSHFSFFSLDFIFLPLSGKQSEAANL